ncbi:PREDICTED: uncharacterized protein LOC104590288 isoform X2 [Nelumbo nucifera]|uniref:Uncharacterized protein LOC104590288 isoform X2 n=1 Tax=Nelumbo nucifera TaxID=4432 RepID=A0A1U7Z266_NELNU|nr:PREDICTED: uncharacterized protein LOC104590288 isoform X2 [Nelumbo nucifera]
MAKHWFRSWNFAGIFVGSEEFWRENVHGGWATIIVLLFIVIWHSARSFPKRFRSSSSPQNAKTTFSPSGNPQIKVSEIVSDDDLKILIKDLDGRLDETEKWEDVIEKRNEMLSYNAKCCKPKDGPLKYLSVTIFEDCTTELVRDFYMDNEYRKQWDKTWIEHEQLQIDESNGTEIGRSVKKFPLLTPREYVLTWRLWEGKDKTFYCFIKECQHALAPLQKKYVRVGFFRSGWRIRKVPGRNACEIKMVHQEDAGLNVEMTKLVFAKGIWSYVCKMDSALRKYSLRSCPHPRSSLTAVNFIQKVPPEFEIMPTEIHPNFLGSSVSSSSSRQVVGDVKERKISRPSKKWIANGLLLLGGVICLCRGHSAVGAKLAVACILKKLAKHKSSTSQTGQSQAVHDSLYRN